MEELHQKLQWNRNNTILRQYIIMAAIFVIVMFLVTILPGKTAYAIEDEKKPNYEVIMIRPGDSLWSIATEYYTKECNSIKEYVEWIKNCNSLYDDTIHAGCYLIVPYYNDVTVDC